MSWDPYLYLRYAGERLRPAVDLLAAVPAERPARVVDLGCGAGNVTVLLQRRWPEAEVTGVDNSPEMIERAGQAAPGAAFELGDIGRWRPPALVDVIFSNAALQWLPQHETLLPGLLAELQPGGVLAVQMPVMHAAPLRQVQVEVAATGPWAAALEGVSSAFPVLAPEAYWDLLRPRCRGLEIWETTYLHALAGEDAAVQWAAGTSLRPYLDALEPPLRPAFLAAYAEALRPHYPPRADGTTLLPFRRLFIVAQM